MPNVTDKFTPTYDLDSFKQSKNEAIFYGNCKI